MSGYGECATRAFIWLLAIWFVFAVYYTISSTSADSSWIHGVLEGLHISLRTMILQGDIGRSFPQTVQTILGPLQIALFGLALRRRMNR